MSEQDKLRKSLRFSFLDGIFASCMAGLTTDYITPYALALKATTKQIGLLNALPNLTSSIFQMKSADMTERLGSRRNIINIFVFLHAAMLLPIALLPFLNIANKANLLILCVSLYATFVAIAVPPWSSLMSDHVPESERGRYFAWRNKVLGFLAAVASFFSGFILQIFKRDVLMGFWIIFTLAFTFRLISWYFLTRMYEPPLEVTKEHYFTFLDFLKRIRESNFAKFVLFVASLNFCVNLASPYFSVFMLRDLKFNYLTYTIITVTVTIAHMIMLDRWGRHADRIGNVKILRLVSIFIGIIPFLWLVCQRPVYLIFAQIVSGFAWSGFNLCATNFIYDTVSPEKRIRCISYFNALNGVGICCGALIGGYLTQHLPQICGFRLLNLFMISGILRLIVVFVFQKEIKEVRPVKKITSKKLFYSVIGIRPVALIAQE